QIQDVVLREKLLSINRLIANIESLNDNPTLDHVLNSSVSFPISEESDNSLSDNFSPEFETFCDNTKETRSGNTTTHANDSLPEYDSFCFKIETDQESNESSESDFDNPSVPLPPPEPPDAEFDFELDAGEEILVVMNDNDDLECLKPKDEFENGDYFPFMFVIRIFLPYLICSKMFLSFLSGKSEDTIFDPGISV
nr:hypothetical protein [Tanacetum cinerariifolium]